MVENVPKRPITEVIAENLAYWMKQHATLKTQASLGAAAGVAQTTIGNYLNPKQRLEGAKGKPPSPKVVELERIADALGIGVWALVRPMTPRERAYYQKIEEAFATLVENDPTGTTGTTQTGDLEADPKVTKIGTSSDRGGLRMTAEQKRRAAARTAARAGKSQTAKKG